MNTPAIANTLNRARSATGKGITYQMGAGGDYPADPLPTRTRACDCSGLVSWALCLSREPKPARNWWLSTTNIWKDGLGPRTVFTEVNDPRPGDVVVYPADEFGDGHCGIVAGVLHYDLGEGFYGTVVDCCSSENGITEHVQVAFEGQGDTIVCRLVEWN